MKQSEIATVSPEILSGADIFEDLLVECTLEAQKLSHKVVDVRVFLEALIESVVVVDACGVIVMVNAAAERLFGYTRSELLGQPLAMLLPERLRERHARHMAAFFRAPRPRPMGEGLELIGLRKDGTEFPVAVSLSYLEVAGISLVPAFVVDLSERMEMETVRQQLTEELQARNRELEAYAYTVAHDLKGPLGLILGYAELLHDVGLTLDAKTFALATEQIVHSSKRLARIIHELLLLAMMRREDLRFEPLDMARILAELEETLAWLQQKYGGDIEIPKVWPTAMGYATWVEEVWLNYISNAFKYGGEPPHVVLGFTVLEDNMVKFWVQDNGPGLTQEQQATLFKPFIRLDQVRATGSGLGLSIVADLVARMRGKVGIESEMGKGSVFSFTLPACV